MMTLPRGQIYLRMPELTSAFLKILFFRLGNGKKVREFESLLSRYYGKSALVLFQARIAFYYVLKNLNLAEGSHVLMTPLTIADMVNMVHILGLKPVFCDLGRQTYNIDYQDLEDKITDRTKVLFITHLNGFASDMDKIMEIAAEHNLFLIEDCSQSFGAKFKGRHLGTFGRTGIFSLSLFKTCSTLFGGAIISDDAELIEKIKDDTKGFPLPAKSILLSEIIKNIIFDIATNRVIFSVFTYYLIKLLGKRLVNRFIMSNPETVLGDCLVGKLYSYTDVQAEMGIKKLADIDQQDDKRIENAQLLFDRVSPEVRAHLPKTVEKARNVYWRLPIRVERPEHFIRHMLKNYIDMTQTNLVLCSQEPAFRQYSADTPEAFDSKSKTVFVPIHSGFTEKDMICMAEALNNYFR